VEQQVCTDLQRTARRTCRYGIPHTHAVRCCQLTITWLGPLISGDADDEPCMSTSQWAKCVRLDPPVQNTSVRHQVRSCPADKSRCRCAAPRTLPWQCPRASSVLPGSRRSRRASAAKSWLPPLPHPQPPKPTLRPPTPLAGQPACAGCLSFSGICQQQNKARTASAARGHTGAAAGDVRRIMRQSRCVERVHPP